MAAQSGGEPRMDFLMATTRTQGTGTQGTGTQNTRAQRTGTQNTRAQNTRTQGISVLRFVGSCATLLLWLMGGSSTLLADWRDDVG